MGTPLTREEPLARVEISAVGSRHGEPVRLDIELCVRPLRDDDHLLNEAGEGLVEAGKIERGSTEWTEVWSDAECMILFAGQMLETVPDTRTFGAEGLDR